MLAAPLISIVDDDALARDGIRELVEALGYKAATFKSTEDFLQSGLIANTSCLITDLQMPGLSGLELQETLRSKGYDTPIIFVTAYPNENHRTRALNAGAVGFLSKPFNEQSLIRFLNVATKSGSSGFKASRTVFAAASLKNSLDDVDTAFTKHSGIKVVVSYGASSALAKQIEQGAPADIFVSADLKWMDYGVQKKVIKDDTREPNVKIVGVFPDDTHDPIIYPVALTATAMPDAVQYLSFLRSQTAKSVFESCGFNFLVKPSS
jgi:FixJ family two-component response regulator